VPWRPNHQIFATLPACELDQQPLYAFRAPPGVSPALSTSIIASATSNRIIIRRPPAAVSAAALPPGPIPAQPRDETPVV